jgi:predicted solute-binding protein
MPAIAAEFYDLAGLPAVFAAILAVWAVLVDHAVT